MGEHLFSVTLITLFMFFWIDIFRSWYVKFLTRRRVAKKTIDNLMRILWSILALVFWYTLMHRGMPEEFDITHFSYALFIFSLYGLLRAFWPGKSEGK
ncbi:hypothetical protein JXA02_10840 [candidate division KSB1 bacterium]|nr:hypothetical protein [candidate division KSB1 bacterium]RQW02988.1 MAG: hypothetical protein EH222_12910 [candidate division KSB1 bacterium]